ncbi:MAG: hypothetical protein IKC65_01295, partial [Lentisphaeria bacterium]|nr:hypothetical protein [Lentisphaeria bacterium]
YFTADQAGRRLKNRAETVRLDPGKEGALFTINLIDYASVLDKPVTWSFGLHVTPMRPFKRNRLLWRASTYAYKGVGVVSWFPWADIHNVPEARFKKADYAIRRRNLSGRHTVPIFHYFAGFSTSPENPAFPQYANKWSITPPTVGTEASPNNREWRYVFVCANSPSYRSYYLQNLEKCIKELKMEHLYFDNDLSYYCSNASHGCGWRDEHGKLYPSSNVLGTRELAKGCYRIQRRIYPGGLTIRHLSQTPETGLVSFADCILDGESFVDDVADDENYFRIFKPDYVRACFKGRQFGVPWFYMQQFMRAYGLHAPEKLKLARQGKLKNQDLHQRHLMGYMYVHDTGIHALDTKAIRPFWNVLADAGVGNNTAFWGYWNKENPVKKLSPADERVMVSSFAAKDGVLAVMLNDLDKPVTVKLAFDGKFLGKTPAVYDAENKEKIEQGKVLLPARTVRMLRVVKK